jgi:hypothetical protein
MPGFKLLKEFLCRSNFAFSRILQALPDAFAGLSPSRNVEQALISRGILHHRCGFSPYGEHNWALAFFQKLHKVAREPPESRQRLDVLRDVKHEPILCL